MCVYFYRSSGSTGETKETTNDGLQFVNHGGIFLSASGDVYTYMSVAHGSDVN